MQDIDIAWEVEGLLSPAESIAGMLAVITQKGLADSGTFWTWDGRVSARGQCRASLTSHSNTHGDGQARGGLQVEETVPAASRLAAHDISSAGICTLALPSAVICTLALRSAGFCTLAPPFAGFYINCMSCPLYDEETATQLLQQAHQTSSPDAQTQRCDATTTRASGTPT